MRASGTYAIVIVGYGLPGRAENIDLLAERFGERYGHPVVMACHAVFHDPQLSEAFGKCVRGGARRILVIPILFSLDAREISDLANIIQEEARKLKDVKVVIGGPLGFDELIHAVEKRISESKEYPDVRELTLATRREYLDALLH